MQHFADFGIVKQQNRLKKKTWEKQPIVDAGVDNINRWDINEARAMRNHEALPNEKVLKGRLKPDTKNYYDVRQTNDHAASGSGYLGYQKDPFKGYGGMMEEPVPLLQKKIKLKY